MAKQTASLNDAIVQLLEVAERLRRSEKQRSRFRRAVVELNESHWQSILERCLSALGDTTPSIGSSQSRTCEDWTKLIGQEFHITGCSFSKEKKDFKKTAVKLIDVDDHKRRCLMLEMSRQLGQIPTHTHRREAMIRIDRRYRRIGHIGLLSHNPCAAARTHDKLNLLSGSIAH